MIVYIQDSNNKWIHVNAGSDTWEDAYSLLQFEASLKDYWEIKPKYKKAIVISFETLEVRIYNLNKGEVTRVK